MEAIRLLKTAGSTLKNEGVASFVERTHASLDARFYGYLRSKKRKTGSVFYDVLFINGCDPNIVPHPIRYRVDHQIDQLRSCGLMVDKIEADELTVDHARNARAFIVFRFPYTDTMGEFIARAKELNKLVLYDIDDLVIDTAYTDDIPFIQAMSKEDRELYDEGVRRMGKTLALCDGAITTTETLADELRKYVPEVFVNRNVASERMVGLSEKALYKKNVLPTLEKNQVPKAYAKQYQLTKQQASDADENTVRIGYFSGSITHNDDFTMIMPSLIYAMEAYPFVRLTLMGELDIPPELDHLRDRIDILPFSDWTELPDVICRVDINLAPLCDTLFNRAKSEIKWIEAALVKVPTIASDVGAFAKMIEPGITGLLCSTPDEWTENLLYLIDSPEERTRIGEAAYAYCHEHCVTIGTGLPLARHVRNRWKPNIMFALPSLKTSGGVMVLLKHAAFLQEVGYDVTLLNTDDDFRWREFDGRQLPVLNREARNHRIEDTPLEGSIDHGIATLWDTLRFFYGYSNVARITYLVQGYETDFFAPADPRRPAAEATYCQNDIAYATVSRWCQRWLKDRYGHVARYAPNGLDTSVFYPTERDFSGKIRILIEGDCESIPKNVDESFAITNRLDPERFEVWYMSYEGTSKAFYRIDENLGAVPHEEVADVYRSCHILVKSSIFESFSYPPLEMMSTGGFVVALLNDGNSEYLENEENCLTYERYDIEGALKAIQRICDELELRRTLYENGLETARSRDWNAIKNEIIAIYR